MFQIAEMLSIPVSEVAVRYDFYKFKRFFDKTILSSIKGPYRSYFTYILLLLQVDRDWGLQAQPNFSSYWDVQEGFSPNDSILGFPVN